MTTALLPTRDPQHLIQEQLTGIAAWSNHLQDALGVDGQSRADRRRQVAFLERVNAALEACLRRRANGLAPLVARPRAVVVHRDDAVRRELALALESEGIAVLGEGADGAVALALTVVEQPDVLVIESGLAWGSVAEIATAAKQFAPGTLVALHVDDVSEVAERLHGLSVAVFSRAVPPAEMSEQIAALLAGA